MRDGSGSWVRAEPLAVVGNRLCTGLAEVTSDLAVLEGGGFWAVVLPFSGEPCCARFENVRAARPWPGADWNGPDARSWTSGLDEGSFMAGVEAIRASIRDGDVYQVNLTRRVSAPLPTHRDDDGRTDIAALGAALARLNPAPYSAVVRLPDQGIHVASASPERFLRRAGDRVWSSPIKGTAATPDGFSDKDRAENLMIVDLVRNDLGRVCRYGSVGVPELWSVERHPGLYHLVSTVEGRLVGGVGWPELIGATFPPGSVTGAPKEASLAHIARLEPVDRGVYCGAIGWVDADRCEGELNVAIRTFWIEQGRPGTASLLHFGTGGGITWGSKHPRHEWEETELKARNLLAAASTPASSTPASSISASSIPASSTPTAASFRDGYDR